MPDEDELRAMGAEQIAGHFMIGIEYTPMEDTQLMKKLTFVFTGNIKCPPPVVYQKAPTHQVRLKGDPLRIEFGLLNSIKRYRKTE
jgi:hypothetical protein